MRRLAGPHMVERLKRFGPVRKFRTANRIDVRHMVPQMAPTTRARIEEELADEVLLLARILNRETLPWQTWQRLSDTRRAPGDAAPVTDSSREGQLARG